MLISIVNGCIHWVGACVGVAHVYMHATHIQLFNFIHSQAVGTQTFLNPPTFLSGYHTDTPITIKAEAILKANSHPH